MLEKDPVTLTTVPGDRTRLASSAFSGAPPDDTNAGHPTTARPDRIQPGWICCGC